MNKPDLELVFNFKDKEIFRWAASRREEDKNRPISPDEVIEALHSYEYLIMSRYDELCKKDKEWIFHM